MGWGGGQQLSFVAASALSSSSCEATTIIMLIILSLYGGSAAGGIIIFFLLIPAVWRRLTQMCWWSRPQWLPGAGHSSLWWFLAGMSTAGTGFCSVAVRTAVTMERRIELRIKLEKQPSSSSSSLDARSCVEAIVPSLSHSGSSLQFTSVQFSSVQFKMVSVRSEKPICASPHLSEVSPMLPLKQWV